jgi:hypothetical protein
MAFGKRKPQPTFEEGIARWMKRRDQAPLPRVHRAMWKGDAQFENDLSDPEVFNERYIESQLAVPSLVDTLYITSTIHTISLVCLGACVISDPSFWWTALLIYVLWNAPFFFLPLCLLSRPIGGIRFNRQAQVVHVMRGKNKALSIPWRDVRPFLREKGLGHVELKLAFPPPPGVEGDDGILWLEGEFDDIDDCAIDRVSLRFEFIRRYMEEGLEAIQPTAKMERYRKPSGPQRIPSFYWPGFGFLIDRWVYPRQNKFRWPKDVERLGEPGANLSGFDTRPVVSDKHIFYRYDVVNGGFYLCDGNGHRLPSLVDADLHTSANDA